MKEIKVLIINISPEIILIKYNYCYLIFLYFSNYQYILLIQ